MANNELNQFTPEMQESSEKIANACRKNIKDLKKALKEFNENDSKTFTAEQKEAVLNFAFYNAIYSQEFDKVTLLFNNGANPIYATDYDLDRNIKPLCEVAKTCNADFTKQYLTLVENYTLKLISNGISKNNAAQIITSAFETSYENYGNKNIIEIAKENSNVNLNKIIEEKLSVENGNSSTNQSVLTSFGRFLSALTNNSNVNSKSQSVNQNNSPIQKITLNDKEQNMENNNQQSNNETKKIDLNEILSLVEFEYEIVDEKINLIDTQKAYLGNGFDEDGNEYGSYEGFENISDVIDRLEVYYNDYLINDITNTLYELDTNIDTSNISNMSWEELSNFIKSNHLEDKIDGIGYLNAIVNPSLIENPLDKIQEQNILLSPNGKQSNLSKEDYDFIRSDEFKQFAGEWEFKAASEFALNSESVAKITGNEFQKEEGKSIIDNVLTFYKSVYDGKINNNNIGTVTLDKEGIKDSLAHGISKTKAAAYAVVPAIIENGYLYNQQKNWKERNYDTATLIAPITMGNKEYIGEVVLKQRPNKTGFYLHEVELKEKLVEMFKTSTKGSISTSSYLIITKHLDKVNSCNIKFDENFEPLKSEIERIRYEINQSKLKENSMQLTEKQIANNKKLEELINEVDKQLENDDGYLSLPEISDDEKYEERTNKIFDLLKTQFTEYINGERTEEQLIGGNIEEFAEYLNVYTNVTMRGFEIEDLCLQEYNKFGTQKLQSNLSNTSLGSYFLVPLHSEGIEEQNVSLNYLLTHIKQFHDENNLNYLEMTDDYLGHSTYVKNIMLKQFDDFCNGKIQENELWKGNIKDFAAELYWTAAFIDNEEFIQMAKKEVESKGTASFARTMKELSKSADAFDFITDDHSTDYEKIFDEIIASEKTQNLSKELKPFTCKIIEKGNVITYETFESRTKSELYTQVAHYFESNKYGWQVERKIADPKMKEEFNKWRAANFNNLFSHTSNFGTVTPMNDLYFKINRTFNSPILSEYIENKGVYVDDIVDTMDENITQINIALDSHEQIESLFPNTFPTADGGEIYIHVPANEEEYDFSKIKCTFQPYNLTSLETTGGFYEQDINITLSNEDILNLIKLTPFTRGAEKLEQSLNEKSHKIENKEQQQLPILEINSIKDEIKKDKEFIFKGNIEEKFIENSLNSEQQDDWQINIAELKINDNLTIGIDINFSKDISDGEIVNQSALYLAKYDGEIAYTEYNKFIHYEIDFTKDDWKSKLEQKCYSALQNWKQEILQEQSQDIYYYSTNEFIKVFNQNKPENTPKMTKDIAFSLQSGLSEMQYDVGFNRTTNKYFIIDKQLDDNNKEYENANDFFADIINLPHKHYQFDIYDSIEKGEWDDEKAGKQLLNFKQFCDEFNTVLNEQSQEVENNISQTKINYDWSTFTENDFEKLKEAIKTSNYEAYQDKIMNIGTISLEFMIDTIASQLGVPNRIYHYVNGFILGQEGYDKTEKGIPYNDIDPFYPYDVSKENEEKEFLNLSYEEFKNRVETYFNREISKNPEWLKAAQFPTFNKWHDYTPEQFEQWKTENKLVIKQSVTNEMNIEAVKVVYDELGLDFEQDRFEYDEYDEDDGNGNITLNSGNDDNDYVWYLSNTGDANFLVNNETLEIIDDQLEIANIMNLDLFKSEMIVVIEENDSDLIREKTDLISEIVNDRIEKFSELNNSIKAEYTSLGKNENDSYLYSIQFTSINQNILTNVVSSVDSELSEQGIEVTEKQQINIGFKPKTEEEQMYLADVQSVIKENNLDVIITGIKEYDSPDKVNTTDKNVLIEYVSLSEQVREDDFFEMLKAYQELKDIKHESFKIANQVMYPKTNGIADDDYLYNGSNAEKLNTINNAINEFKTKSEEKELTKKELNQLETLIKGKDACEHGIDSLNYIRPNAKQLFIGFDAGWNFEDVIRGYGEFTDGKNESITLEKLDEMNVFDNYDDIQKMAEVDGYNILDIEKDYSLSNEEGMIYIDTPENRELLKEYVIEEIEEKIIINNPVSLEVILRNNTKIGSTVVNPPMFSESIADTVLKELESLDYTLIHNVNSDDEKFIMQDEKNTNDSFTFSANESDEFVKTFLIRVNQAFDDFYDTDEETYDISEFRHYFNEYLNYTIDFTNSYELKTFLNNKNVTLSDCNLIIEALHESNYSLETAYKINKDNFKFSIVDDEDGRADFESYNKNHFIKNVLLKANRYLEEKEYPSLDDGEYDEHLERKQQLESFRNKFESVYQHYNKLSMVYEISIGKNNFTFFVKDTAEFEVFEGFEPITNLTAEEAVQKFIELSKQNLNCGIGIYIPGDFIFDKNNGVCLFIKFNDEYTFNLSDYFIKQLKVNDEHAQNLIEAFKTLDEAIKESSIIDTGKYVEPKFVYEKEKELNLTVPQKAQNWTIEKLQAAGIEVISDKDEFNKILESEKLLQKMSVDLSEIEELSKQLNEEKEKTQELNEDKSLLKEKEKDIALTKWNEFKNVVLQVEDKIPYENKRTLSIYAKKYEGIDVSIDFLTPSVYKTGTKPPYKPVLYIRKGYDKEYIDLNNFDYFYDKFVKNNKLTNNKYFPETEVFIENFKQEFKKIIIKEQQNQSSLIQNISSLEKELKTEKRIESISDTIESDFAALDKSLRFNANFEIESSKLRENVSVFPGSTGKSGLGIRHLIEQRYKNDNLSIDEITALTGLVLDSVRNGEITRETYNQTEFTKNGIIAIVRRDYFGQKENWVLTGFAYDESDLEKNREATETIKTVNAKYSQSQDYSYFRNQVGAVLASLDLNISENIKKSSTQNMTLQDGTTYGFTHEGKIYLNPDVVNSSTPIHEYTHLWDNYIQNTNSELWTKGKEAFKNTVIWNEVINDPHYADIADNDDLVLSECHARITGKVAEKILERIARENGEIKKDEIIDWDKETWVYIAENYSQDISKFVSVAEFIQTPMKVLMDARNINLEHSNEQFTPILSENFEYHLNNNTSKIEIYPNEISNYLPNVINYNFDIDHPKNDVQKAIAAYWKTAIEDDLNGTDRNEDDLDFIRLSINEADWGGEDVIDIEVLLNSVKIKHPELEKQMFNAMKNELSDFIEGKIDELTLYDDEDDYINFALEYTNCTNEETSKLIDVAIKGLMNNRPLAMQSMTEHYICDKEITEKTLTALDELISVNSEELLSNDNDKKLLSLLSNLQYAEISDDELFDYLNSKQQFESKVIDSLYISKFDRINDIFGELEQEINEDDKRYSLLQESFQEFKQLCKECDYTKEFKLNTLSFNDFNSFQKVNHQMIVEAIADSHKYYEYELTINNGYIYQRDISPEDGTLLSEPANLKDLIYFVAHERADDLLNAGVITEEQLKACRIEYFDRLPALDKIKVFNEACERDFDFTTSKSLTDGLKAMLKDYEEKGCKIVVHEKGKIEIYESPESQVKIANSFEQLIEDYNKEQNFKLEEKIVAPKLSEKQVITNFLNEVNNNLKDKSDTNQVLLQFSLSLMNVNETQRPIIENYILKVSNGSKDETSFGKAIQKEIAKLNQTKNSPKKSKSDDIGMGR